MVTVTLPSERRTYTDTVGGVTVHQLTDHLAHSYHLYFTNFGWWNGNRNLLFGSDRGNAANLYSVDTETGVITRLTDFGRTAAHDFQGAAVSPTRDEAYWWNGGKLHAIDLRTAAVRVLYTCPDDWSAYGGNASADGKYVCASMGAKVNVGPVDLGAGYIGFREIFEAHAPHRVIRVPVDGGDMEVLHEERNWIGHVNPSPTQPHLLTYCYEGPWHLVGQRMWGLDMRTGRTWKIREQGPDEMFGHEYWMADGVTVGYHGKAKGAGVYGFTRYDNEGRVELPFPLDSNHFHSNTPDLIVADGPAQGLTPHVLLCRFDGRRFDGPRVLCVHRGSRHIQHLHVHPRFTPDGKQVLYTSDPKGYGQLFLADVPPFESLPTLEEVQARKRR